MFVKKAGNGKLYIFKGKPSNKKIGKNSFLVRYGCYGGGLIQSKGKIHLPSKFRGKRVRFRMEVVK